MGRKQQLKRPPGVKIREWDSGRTTLMIQFYYRGVVCRETLSMAATAANLSYAARLRGEILNAIERQTFNYADFFPDSPFARRFGHAAKRMLITELLDAYLADYERRVENSTYTRTVKSCRTHLYPSFGHIAIQDLNSRMIRDWVKKQRSKKKTISNILGPLRGLVEQALMDEYIDHNPFDKVFLNKLIPKKAVKSDFVVDPFDRDEINVILATASEQIKHYIQLAFFTGLRPSELFGLRWGDIDWIHGVIRISETIVDRRVKGPKTEAGYRDVLLLPPALAALQAQKAFSFLANDRVFLNPRTNKPWENSQQFRRTAWIPLLKRAGIRYRNPYQTRHTYASMMLSQGENVMWLSRQMGHTDAQVTLRRYARWLPDTSAQGGYQTRYDWHAYLGDDKANGSTSNHRIILSNNS